MSNQPSLPRNITLHLTENCNLRCRMCYYWGETGAYSTKISRKKPEILDFDILKKVIHDLRNGNPRYSLFGGEPLLYPYFEELVWEIKKYECFIDTPTNGTLLSDNTEVLVNNGFDLVRVSIDGPRETNDMQRGDGSYDKAMKGINDIFAAKKRNKKKKPFIDVIYTITANNYLAVEEFFLENLDLNKIDSITIQMQNFITESMGENYAEFLRSEFGIQSDTFWKGMVQSPTDFDGIDVTELSRQITIVKKHYFSQKKNVMLLPPTFSQENIKAYLTADWKHMTDVYEKCFVPWVSADIVANGDVAPCHIFYDLVLGNLYDNSIVDIWNGEKYKRFRDYMESNKFMPICPGCCILYLSGKKRRTKK
ncbi:MAG: radical SAM protein [Candidatus Hermodarchaeota archaeon]